MDRVLEKIFRVGSGMDWVRVFASCKEPIGYYRVLKNLIGYFSGISSMWHIYFMECLVRDFKWCIYGESNQKVKVLLEFCALPFCGSLSIGCLKLRISRVPVFKFQKMSLRLVLQIRKHKNGDHFLIPTSLRKGWLHICLVHLPLSGGLSTNS